MNAAIHLSVGGLARINCPCRDDDPTRRGGWRWQLDRGATVGLTLPRRDRAWLRVASGSVWVTTGTDGVDHVLRRGERVAIDGTGRVVATALTDAAIAIDPAD